MAKTSLVSLKGKQITYRGGQRGPGKEKGNVRREAGTECLETVVKSVMPDHHQKVKAPGLALKNYSFRE